MTKTSIVRFFVAATLAVAGFTPLLGNAEQFTDGMAGVRLGMGRAAALEALLENGLQLDVDNIVCLETVADKYKPYADRLCKMPTLPGSKYLGVPIMKVSLMFKDDQVVLVGLEVGPAQSAYLDMLGKLFPLLGAPPDAHDGNAMWNEAPDVQRPTATKLVADQSVAYLVYSDSAMR